MLVEQGRPAFTVTKLGVPLVWVFPYSEVARLGVEQQPVIGRTSFQKAKK